ncbi:MAG: site-specific integrase [Planctomycetes bacterium]|nr:site-specific integrase [Planctomycetota bacterium]
MRQPKPWYRKWKSTWYVELDGKQHFLGQHPKDSPPPKKLNGEWKPPASILDAFYKLMANKPENLPSADELRVTTLCDLFLEHSHKHHSPETYGLYKLYLDQFCGVNGRQLATGIKPFHITRWLDDHPRWKASRRHAALAVKRAFGWADKQGLLSPSPLRLLEVEPGNSRTRVLTAAERAEILAAIRDEQFREFVFAMLETGCRPGEVSRLTAANANLAVGVWTFEKHKTAKKTGKPRVVYLTPAMVELTRKLVAKYPEGRLFRGPRGAKPFTQNGIRCRFRRLREKLPHLKHFVGYTMRHTFATQALVNGVGVAQVAELLGHSSIEMVSQHYGHLAEQVAHMLEAAKKATGGA